MKKFLFIIFMFLIFSLNIDAISYECSISNEKDYITAYEEGLNESSLYTYMNVDITNIENIESLSLYVKYDSKKYDVQGCHFLNYNTSGCSLSLKSNNIIYYDYKYSDSYKIKDYPFFYVNFMSNQNTPKSGSTKVEVYFDSAKDKNGNSISIKGCSKTFTFKKDENAEAIDNTQTDIEIDGYTVLIDGYDFKFDRDKYEYSLDVDKDVNSLDVKVLVDEDYKYTMTGAADLNTFGNKITITITDNENNEKNYVININKEKTEIKKTPGAKSVAKNIFSSIDVKKYIIGGLIIVISLIVLIAIIKKLTSRKIDKYLDKL